MKPLFLASLFASHYRYASRATEAETVTVSDGSEIKIVVEVPGAAEEGTEHAEQDK